MKKCTLAFMAVLLSLHTAWAGGLVTNTNQSATWTRMLARDASTEIDAVYYNPAGLTKLADGLHVSVNNQTLLQTKTIENSYALLNDAPKTYEGKVSAPLFPGVYAAYKTGKFAFSFGFNPVGGGGGAVYDGGLPSLEIPVSELKAARATFAPLVAGMSELSANSLSLFIMGLMPDTYSKALTSDEVNVTSYSLSQRFEGSSVYFGYQLGVSYAINDMISVYAGARYVQAKDTYMGHLNDIMVTTQGGNTLSAINYFQNIINSISGPHGAATYAATAAQNTGFAAESAKAVYDGFAPALTTLGTTSLQTYLSMAVAGGQLTTDDVDMINGTLYLIGQNPNAMTLQESYEAFVGLEQQLIGTQTDLQDAADEMNAVVPTLVASQTLLADQEVDATKQGTSFAPIVGLNLNLMEGKLNIGMKYEFQATMELTTTADADKQGLTGLNPDGSPIYLFANDSKESATMPALLTFGADYKVSDKLNVSVGLHSYFDKQTDWDNLDAIDNNFWEAALGIEYSLSDKLLLSTGVLHAHTGVNSLYQSDLTASVSTNTYGIGGKYNINESLSVDFGTFFTYYFTGTKEYAARSTGMGYAETYNKTAFGIGVGVNYTLAK